MPDNNPYIMLFIQISEDLKNAMKAKEQNKVDALRLVFAKIKDEAIDKGQRNEISDEIVLSVLKKRVKQGKDSITQFKEANRPELAKNEQNQLDVLSKYLPAEMTKEKIEEIVAVKKRELGITDPSKMGILMGAVMKEVAGQADGNKVKQIVSKALN